MENWQMALALISGLANVALAAECWRLHRRSRGLTIAVMSLAARVASQSELLSLRAERNGKPLRFGADDCND